MTHRTVIIESPLQGGTDREPDNPGVLDDTDPGQRRTGMEAGFAIGRRLDARVVYVDRGITPGMLDGIRESPVGQLHFRTFDRTPAPSPARSMTLDEVFAKFPAVADALVDAAKDPTP